MVAIERSEGCEFITVRDGYDRIAPEYDDRLAPINAVEEMFVRTERDFILGAIRAGDRILDLGCGTGRMSLQAAGTGADVTGVDISEGMLREARRKASEGGLQATFRHANILDLPFASGSFDAVISTLALMHIDPVDRSRAFAEVARVVRPGGVVALSLKNLRIEQTFKNDRFVLNDVVDTEEQTIVFTQNRVGEAFAVPWSSFYPEDVEQLLREAGLSVERVKANIPIATWIADAALERNPELRAMISALEAVLSETPPLNHLGWYTLVAARKPM